MGTRSSMFQCRDCFHEWWEWFDGLSRDELREFADATTCPECDGANWVLTDATEFAGGPVYTTHEDCPECGYGGSVRLHCPSGHEWKPQLPVSKAHIDPDDID